MINNQALIRFLCVLLLAQQVRAEEQDSIQDNLIRIVASNPYARRDLLSLENEMESLQEDLGDADGGIGGIYEDTLKRRRLVKQTPVDQIEASVHQCVHYTRKVTKLQTEIDPPTICVGCDPTTPFCDPLCQKWIEYQFAACNGVCLPDGFFFDASKSKLAEHFKIFYS